MNKKAAIYIRVSTHWQVDKDSLQVQRRELAAYCNMILGITDFEVFEDAGYSAKNTDRPAYQQMVRRLRQGEFSHLVVWKIDRISRNILDFASMYAELKTLGVIFVSKNEQFDTSSAIGEAMLKIILVFAELERNMTAERVSAVMVSRASNGDWNGGRIPYGYSYDKETKTISVNDSERTVYEYIINSYIQGRSILWITRDLNSRLIPTRSGKPWNATGVNKIMRNPFYTGDYVYNKRDEQFNKMRPKSEWITITDHHTAIINRQKFDYIQKQLTKNRTSGAHTHHNIHLFAGLVKCGKCGGTMIAMNNGSRTATWNPSRYFCATHRNNKHVCDNASTSDVILAPFMFSLVGNIINAQNAQNISVKKFKQMLLKNIPYTDFEDAGVRELLSHIRESGNNYSPIFQPPETELDNLENEKRRTETALARLTTIYLHSDSPMPEAEYLSEQHRLSSRLEEINRLIDAAPHRSNIEQEATYQIMLHQLQNRDQNFEQFLALGDRNIPKQFFNTIIETITSIDGQVASVTFKNGITIKVKKA